MGDRSVFYKKRVCRKEASKKKKLEGPKEQKNSLPTYKEEDPGALQVLRFPPFALALRKKRTLCNKDGSVKILSSLLEPDEESDRFRVWAI